MRWVLFSAVVKGFIQISSYQSSKDLTRSSVAVLTGGPMQIPWTCIAPRRAIVRERILT